MNHRLPLFLLLLTACTPLWAGLPMMEIIDNANGASITLDDNSRELLVDVDGSGTVTPGDVLVGFLRIEVSHLPTTARPNDVYVVFSHTFNPATFTAMSIGGGLRYSGTFLPTPSSNPYSLDNLLPNNRPPGGFNPGAMMAVITREGGFSKNLTTESLPPLGNIPGAITSILDAEGRVAFTVGFNPAHPDDFFAYETVPLGGPGQPPDFVRDPTVLPTIPASRPLGNFGAGLSILDVFLPITVLKDQTTSFYQNNTGTLFGSGATYEAAIFNGNYGGINLGGGTLIQDGGLSFVNNAKASFHALRKASEVPALAPAGLLGLTALLALFGMRRLRQRGGIRHNASCNRLAIKRSGIARPS